MSNNDPIPVPDWALAMGTLIGPSDHPLRWLIADLMDEMPEHLREPLRMWAWEGLTFEAIAQEMGLAGRSGGQHRVRLALAELERLLKEEGIDSGTVGQRVSDGGDQRLVRGPEGRGIDTVRHVGEPGRTVSEQAGPHHRRADRPGKVRVHRADA